MCSNFSIHSKWTKKRCYDVKGHLDAAGIKFPGCKIQELTAFLDDVKHLGKHITEHCKDSVPVGKHRFL